MSEHDEDDLDLALIDVDMNEEEDYTDETLIKKDLLDEGNTAFGIGIDPDMLSEEDLY